MNTNEDRAVMRRWRCLLGGTLALAAVSAPSGCALRHEIFEPTPGDPGPGALTCTEVRVYEGSGQARPSEHFRETWHPDVRTVSEQFSSTEMYSGKTAFAWRYDARGNLVAYAGFADKPGDVYANFQYDYSYDDRGNLTDLRGSNPGVPDVKMPSTAGTTSETTHQNEYAGSTLIASTSVPYNPNADGGVVMGTRRTFRQNALGQCDLIQSFTLDADTPTMTETRTYDAAGRLETVTLAAAASPWVCASWFTRHMYDGLGRILETRAWCGADDSGDAERVTLYQYKPDGSQTIEWMDFLSDTPNDVVETPSGSRGLTHWILTRTSGCAAIDAAIGAPSGPECRVQDASPRN